MSKEWFCIGEDLASTIELCGSPKENQIDPTHCRKAKTKLEAYELHYPYTSNLSKKNQALKKKCVDHWHEILMLLMLNHLSKSGRLEDDIEIGSTVCPFCKKYLKDSQVNGIECACTGCPIATRTGKPLCYYTPWLAVKNLFYNYTTYKKFFKAITNEINFLESL